MKLLPDGGIETVAAYLEIVYTGLEAGTTSGQQHISEKDPEEINVEDEEQEFEENASNEQMEKCSDDLGEKREVMLLP